MSSFMKAAIPPPLSITGVGAGVGTGSRADQRDRLDDCEALERFFLASARRSRASAACARASSNSTSSSEDEALEEWMLRGVSGRLDSTYPMVGCADTDVSETGML